MPLGSIPGLQSPDWWPDIGTPAFGSALLIDAAGEKAAMVGRVHIEGGLASLSLNRVAFRFGAVTNPALTTLTVSLQDVSLTTGFPDETQDQSVTIPNGSILASTWTDVVLGTRRTVVPGDLLAVVWEYLNFVATASVVISTLGGQLANQICYPALKSGGGPTWAMVTAAASLIPNISLEDTTGSPAGGPAYATLLGAGSWSALTATGINTGTANKEIGVQLQAAPAPRDGGPFPGVIEGAWLFLDLDGDCTINVYESLPDGTGETLLRTITLDKDVRNQSANRLVWVPFAVVNMKPRWLYTLSMLPTSATSVTYGHGSVVDTEVLGALSGGLVYVAVERGTAGAGNTWSPLTATRRFMGFRFLGIRYPVRSMGLAG